MMRGERRATTWTLGAACALGVSAAGAGTFWRDGHRGFALAATFLALLLLLLPYFLFGLGTLAEDFRRWLRESPARLVLVALSLLTPYLLYGLWTGVFTWPSLLTLVAFVVIPTALVFLGRGRSPPGLADVLAVLAIWLPFDFRLLESIWIWPEGRAAYGMSTILAVDLALVLFLGFRGVDRVGYRFRLSGQDLGRIAGSFLVFAAVALPLGLAIDFIAFQPRSSAPGAILKSLPVLFLFIGVPEELLFRGLLQNFLEKAMGTNLRSLAVAAVVFGAAHLNNPPAPNWKYFLMGSLAGVFYGYTWRRSRSVTAAAILHALVDAVWRELFR